MRRLKLLAAALLVSGCVEELETGFGPPAEEGAGTALATNGDDSPPPWDGDGPPPWAGEDPGKPPDSIVHPTRGRIDLTISTADPLLPNADVDLTITGVAQEPVDGGEVVLTLPTRALMDHAGGQWLPDLPVKARWDLPAMAKGDTWIATYTVPAEAAGYYSVADGRAPLRPAGVRRGQGPQLPAVAPAEPRGRSPDRTLRVHAGADQMESEIRRRRFVLQPPPVLRQDRA